METKLNPFRNRLVLKLLFMVALVLMLLIPMSWVEDLIHERQYLQEEVQQDIATAWGEAQQIAGPLLAVPFEKTMLSDDRKTIFKQVLFVSPEEIKLHTDLDTELRYKGIFSTAVYTAQSNMSGQFDLQQITDTDTERYLWEDAVLIMGISDPATITEKVEASWAGDSVRAAPGTRHSEILESGIHLPVPITDDRTNYDFQVSWAYRGSESLSFLPSGRNSQITANANWPDPSFSGKNLPADRNITETAFDARWTASEYNRSFPDQWVGKDQSVNREGGVFGVRLLQRADHYQKNMRSAKYALLIIALSFAVFFFFEIWLKTGIHPIQYAMIGFSLVVFYALLLSLTEHIGFNNAYWASFAAILILLAIYTYGMLGQWKPVALLAGLFGALYGYIFILLQLEDFALLAGAAGLFAILASIMILSRKVDWYQIGSE